LLTVTGTVTVLSLGRPDIGTAIIAVIRNLPLDA
jgi:hypothetical protein